MDDRTDPSSSHPDTQTALEERQAAERACDELLLRIEASVGRALDASDGGQRGNDASVADLVREYSSCARAAGLKPEQMVKPLKVALGRFFYEQRERADHLLRQAILAYFEIAP